MKKLEKMRETFKLGENYKLTDPRSLMNDKKYEEMTRHTGISLLKASGKEKTVKAARGKRHVMSEEPR